MCWHPWPIRALSRLSTNDCDRFGVLHPVSMESKKSGQRAIGQAPLLRRAALLTFVATFVAVLLCSAGSKSAAQVQHRVRPGQTLSRIAKRYHISVAALAAQNRLTTDAALQTGQLLSIPSDGVLFVRRGQTLRSIAKQHHIEADELARANRLRATASLRVGQRLVLPGTDSSDHAPRWGHPRRPGTGTFLRMATHRTARVQLVDRRGAVRRRALPELARLLAPRGSRQTKNPHPQLVRWMARVSDHFGGRTIEIVSGYRPAGGYTRQESRHTQGHAIDFRIRGVPNTELRDYCRTFHHVGVGYYPNSLFVHLDVRRDDTYWVDLSRPGEAPRYAGAGEDNQPEAPTTAAVIDSDISAEPAAADDTAAPVDEAPDQLSDE